MIRQRREGEGNVVDISGRPCTSGMLNDERQRLERARCVCIVLWRISPNGSSFELGMSNELAILYR